MESHETKPRVLSGIQPSGALHIGNYLGAIRNWVEDQSQYENFFCVVDLHGMTVRYDPSALRARSREVAGIYLAAGIDPEKSAIFVQSHVAAHAELAWVLSCVTPIGWLKRMTQFKEKSITRKDNASAGLFTYPVLMAADILLYDAQYVPVGEDQKQHIELCRDIAQAFHHRFGDVFVIPKPMIRKAGARIMSLANPSNKMSKSDADPNGSIHVLDPPKRIRKKFGKAVTDSLTEVRFDRERPGIFNLLSIYQTLTGQSEQAIEAYFEGKLYGHLKREVADRVIAELEPLQRRYAALAADSGYLDEVLRVGAEKASAVAEATMTRVREATGIG